MIARVLVVALALAAAGGCGKKKPAAAAATPAEAAIAKLVGFRDRACNCTDLACVNQAKQDQTEWLLAESAALGKIEFTPAQDVAGAQASKEMAACVAKVEQAAAAKPAPAP